jgi:hypothetical protein
MESKKRADIFFDDSDDGASGDLDIEDDDDDMFEDDDDVEFVEDDDVVPEAKAPKTSATFTDFVNPMKTVPLPPSPVVHTAGAMKTPPGASGTAPFSPSKVPSPGFATIEEEKLDLLFKLDRLRKKGLVSKPYDIHSDILELRTEVSRARTEVELESSIQFSRNMLMATVNALEFLNKRYDPFDLALDGWSGTVMQNIDKYDNVLEKLYYKYRNRISVAPEIELMLSLAGSAFMFHLTNHMFKNIGSKTGGNPDMMQNMMRTMMGGMVQPQPPPQPPPPAQAQPQPQAQPYSMRGPAMDLGPLMSMMSGNMMPPPAIAPPARPSSESFFPPPPPPPPPQQPQVASSSPPRSPQKVERFQDDRLSDIISEDLESVLSMSSWPDSVPDQDIKKVTIVEDATKKGKKTRGKRASAPASGKVLVL